MSKRKCARCGQDPAEGYASFWTQATGKVWLCHGDENMCENCITPWKCNGPHVPTCYELGLPPSDVEVLGVAARMADTWSATLDLLAKED